MTDQTNNPRKKPKPGQKVILNELPPGFVDDLPLEDQRAISEVLGKGVSLNRFEEDGTAELEFTDGEGVIHTLYVDPKFIKT